MRSLHPVGAFAEVAADVSEARASGERNRASDGLGWTSVYLIKAPSIDFAGTSLTLAAADAALAPIMPRVYRFASGIGATLNDDGRDPYGSYEDGAYCYAHDPGCFIKLDDKGDLVERIWFEAITEDAAGLALLRRGLEAIDALTESVIADYWLDCSGAVRDAAFMDAYIRHLSGDA